MTQVVGILVSGKGPRWGSGFWSKAGAHHPSPRMVLRMEIKVGTVGGVIGTFFIRHGSHVDELIPSSQQPCAVDSVIPPLYRGGS